MKNTFRTLFFIFLTFSVISKGQSQKIKIMSFNIRYDNPNDGENKWNKRKSAVANLIEYYHPDFLGIQEGLHHQIQYIKKHTTNYSFIGSGREDGKMKGEFAPIFFDSNKYELVKQQTFWLSESPEKVSKGWDAALERICTYGLFKEKSSGNTIAIFNAHFDHMGEKAREMSAKLILKKIKEYTSKKSKVLVMGDFNSLPNSKAIATFNTQLKDGATSSKSKFYGPKGTFNGFEPNAIVKKRIDYIFIKNLMVFSYRHINDKRQNLLQISDHLPILIEVKL